MRLSLTCVALICSVMMMYAVQAGAETPFADTLPDVKLILQGQGSPTTAEPAFDLDDYVIDNTDAAEDISYASPAVDAGGPVVEIDTSDSGTVEFHEVDVFANGTEGLYGVTFDGQDPDTNPVQLTTTVKYSSFFVTEPRFTADNRLAFRTPSSGETFTNVMLFDGSGSAQQVAVGGLQSDDGVPYTGGATYGPMIMHDLTSGAPSEVARGNSITFGGLEASLSAANGVVWLTPSGALSCAVLISVPVVAQGSSFDATGDWDGAVFMVAPAKLPLSGGPWRNDFSGSGGTAALPSDTLATSTGFENIPAGQLAELQPGGAGTSTANTYITGTWLLLNIGSLALPTVSIAEVSSLPGNIDSANPWAFTGNNCMQISADNSAGSLFMGMTLTSFNITPVEPGEIYGITANIASDIPDGEAANYQENVILKWTAHSSPDFGYVKESIWELASTTVNPTFLLPTGDDALQIYNEFTVPELNFNAGSPEVNLSGKGFRVFLQLLVKPGTEAFNLYVDNLTIYKKNISEINYTDVNDEAGGLAEEGLANGVTAFTPWNKQAAAPTAVVGLDFQQGSDLAANSFPSTTVPPVGNTSAGNSGAANIASFGRLTTAGNNSLQLQVADGIPSDALNDALRVQSRPIAVNGISGGTPIPGAQDIDGPGIYGFSFWISSDASTIVANPTFRLLILENDPTRNQLAQSLQIGPSCIPTAADGWVQYGASAYVPETFGGGAMESLTVSAEILALAEKLTLTDPEWGQFNTAGNYPGYDGDATIYVDDIVVHKVRDDARYWDYSLFD